MNWYSLFINGISVDVFTNSGKGVYHMEHEHQKKVGWIVQDVNTNERLKVIDVRYCEKRHCTMLKLQYQRFKFDMLEIAYPVWESNRNAGVYKLIQKND